MANQDIINYLKEGKKRGFSLQILKQKLIEGGFEDKEINLAISELNRIEMLSKPQPQLQPLSAQSQSIIKPILPSTTQPIQQKTQIISSAPTSKPEVISNQQKILQSQISTTSQLNQSIKSQPLPQTQQIPNQPSQLQTSSSYFNQMPSLNKDSVSLWLKISGVLGVAILVFSFIFSFAVFSLNNPLISVIYIAIIIIFLIAYTFGFLKMGRRLNSKLMKLSSSFILILLFLTLMIFLISAFSENRILESFVAFTSSTNTGFAAFLVISTISILILLIISKILFSISLVKLRNNLRLAGLIGIVSLITCFFAISSLILFIVLIFTSPEVFLNIGSTSLSSLGDSLMKVAATGLLFIISITAMVTLKFISMILEIIMLFKNSKSL